MLHTHHLDTTNHSDFLNQKRIDPITGEKIEEGHTIVICAACKSAFFIESWEYLGNEHCNQEETLSEVPIAKSLQLVAKPLEYLPFPFRQGSYYPWDKKEADNDFYKIILLTIGGVVLGFTLLTMSLFWINNLFLFFLEMIFLSIIVWIIALIFKAKQKKKSFRRKQNISKSIYLSVNSKNQSISYKRREKIKTIPFNQIIELKYKLNYMPFKECAKHNQFILSLDFLTKENKKIRFYTVFHEKEIPHWSNFLEELPYTIPVLNQK